jgi:hypothetical protein
MYENKYASASVSVIIVAILLLAGFFSTQQQFKQARATSDRESNSGEFAGSAGWKEGKNDYLSGKPYGYSCSSDNTDTYCDLYRMGYERGWQEQINLGREYGTDPR